MTDMHVDDAPRPPLDSELATPNKRSLFGRHNLQPDVEQKLVHVLKETPEMARNSLAAQARFMHPKMQTALAQLGRTDVWTTNITMQVPVNQLPSERRVFRINEFQLGHEQIDKLLAEPFVSYVEPLLKEVPDFNGHSVDQDKYESDSQLIVLTGPLYLIFDSEFKELQPTAEPLVVCSVPGINFAYSSADKQRYCGGSGILHEKAIVRMKVIMAHVFECMKQQGVKIPVLNAIGCGAFKGNYYEVPALWATAAATVLSEHDYHFDCVIYCLPNFGDDNFQQFDSKIREFDAHLITPVLLVEDKSMLILADRLLRYHGEKAGVLNPSDWAAMRKGHIGMYWDGGHIALEEIMAMQTTLLFQHRGINPGLYQPDRCRPTHLYPQLIHDAQRLDP